MGHIAYSTERSEGCKFAQYNRALCPYLKLPSSKIVTLVTLVLVLPATSALSERSFSQLYTKNSKVAGKAESL